MGIHGFEPDIVIRADRDHAPCLELKPEAIEGSYPSAGTKRN
jgi:hypothetical protein